MIGVGLIGAGAVVQTVHLPTLARLADEFTVLRVMDTDPVTAERVAARVGAEPTTESSERSLGSAPSGLGPGRHAPRSVPDLGTAGRG